ncbi:hypothetical protein J14TS5_31790 [Paenibacillus lautus]|uniref:hypothetical protein n=1 Tax=Paenibacillus lautus TaxID=1401 RepID=UPI001AFE43D2|nr:hypothetical protein [Paenibacillus lautus]GIO98093.1 hypothetical protein J14TS5_31790 [Paenibacillus lautus]
MSFDFDEDEDDAYKLYQGGRRVTADASGVVTAVVQPDEQKDENQAELDLEGAASEAEAEGNAEHSGDPAGDIPPTEEGEELNDYEKEIMGEGSTQEGSELPEWMQEQQHEEKTERQEMTFEDSDKEPTADGGFDPEESHVSNDEEISEDALEQFILKERPSFEDNPLDFPLLLEKRLNEGKTWVEISKIAGIPTSQIQPKWKKYKEMVTKMMKDGGAA